MYRVIYCDVNDKLNEFINEYCEKGFELVSFSNGVCVFKQKPQNSQQQTVEKIVNQINGIKSQHAVNEFSKEFVLDMLKQLLKP